MFILCSCRVRGMLISPEVRNAIHVGDRILEINGLPVGTMMQQEVGPYSAHATDTHRVACDPTAARRRLISVAIRGEAVSLSAIWKALWVAIVKQMRHVIYLFFFIIPLIPPSFIHCTAGRGWMWLNSHSNNLTSASLHVSSVIIHCSHLFIFWLFHFHVPPPVSCFPYNSSQYYFPSQQLHYCDVITLYCCTQCF